MRIIDTVKAALLENESISKWAREIKTKREKKFFSEKKKSFGAANPDKTVFIIRRRAQNVGLLSLVIVALARMKEAKERGFTPVVDLCHYKNIYLSEDEIGEKNAWEYYFSQPSDVSLSEAYQSRHVVLSSGEIPEDRPSDDVSFLLDHQKTEQWRTLFKQYIHIHQEFLEQAEREYRENVAEGQTVVGVCCRGLQYQKVKPKNHPIQPEVSELIRETEKMMEKHCASKVYLSTEDAAVVEQFRASFQDRLFVKKREYVTYDKDGHRKSGQIRNSTVGGDYLLQLLMLSKCDYIVSARCSGIVGAELMTEGFKDQVILDKGNF